MESHVAFSPGLKPVRMRAELRKFARSGKPLKRFKDLVAHEITWLKPGENEGFRKGVD
jgi:hypothetical protein